MRKQLVLLTTLLGLAFVATGCEVSKGEVAAKKYVLIAHNVSSMACSFVTMDTIVNKFGLKDTNYHEDSNPHATCADYNKTEGDTCGTTDLKSGDSGYGSSSCAIGANALNGGQNKNDTKAKKYIFVIKNVRSDACGKIVIEPIAKGNGYNDVTFYEDKNADCNDFGTARYACKEKVLTNGEKGYGNSTCVVGTDTPPSN